MIVKIVGAESITAEPTAKPIRAETMPKVMKMIGEMTPNTASSSRA